jgi:hypothetical protein
MPHSQEEVGGSLLKPALHSEWCPLDQTTTEDPWSVGSPGLQDFWSAGAVGRTVGEVTAPAQNRFIRRGGETGQVLTTSLIRWHVEQALALPHAREGCMLGPEGVGSGHRAAQHRTWCGRPFPRRQGPVLWHN